MLQAELRVQSGKHAGSSISLPQGKFLVGREEDCHLRPNSDMVSRHHCVFTLDEYGLRLRDLGSTNGSFVNGEQIRGAVVLNSGDKVLIGKLEFQVVVGDPITEETRTNLANELPTQIVSTSEEASDFAADEIMNLAPQASEDDVTDVTEPTPESTPAESPAAQDTMVDMPAQQQPGSIPPEQQQMPPAGDTQYFPPQGMPPQGMPPQMPVGYPPQMGYPPGMMPYGYPGYPQMGYPQMGYPPGMYPPGQAQPGQVQPGQEPPPADDSVGQSQSPEEPPVRLPDPSETGVKAPEPAPPQNAEEGDEKKDERTSDQKAKEEAPNAAAAAIQQYLQRRPKTDK